MNLTDNNISQIISNYGNHFRVDEVGESRHNLNKEAVEMLCHWRAWHKFPIFISSAWRSEGAHKEGAFDVFLFNDWQVTQPEPMHLWRIATTFPFLGVGIYFDTHAFDEQAIMLHVDIAEQRDRPLRWIRARGNYYYQNVKTGNFWNKDLKEATTLANEINMYK